MDRFSKTCLVLIVLLLATIALRTSNTPQFAYAQTVPKSTNKPMAAQETAATPKYHEYTWLQYGDAEMDPLASKLGELSAGGWQVVGVTSEGQYGNQILVVVGR